MSYVRAFLFLFPLISTIPLLAHKDPSTIIEASPDGKPGPWFTGPLLSPSGHVIPYGHYNVEPTQYTGVNRGIFNSHWKTRSIPNFYSLATQTTIQFGLPADFDIALNPTWAWNHVQGASHWVLNDLPMGFDYQLYKHKVGGFWLPSIKLNIHWTLPLGRYQKLNPKSKLTDLGGEGSWAPGVGLSTSHLFWYGGHIFFSPRLSVQYTFATPVHVKSYNAYGGGHGTRGKVFPNQFLNIYFGFELSLSQNWVLATDIAYQHTTKTRFKGEKGATDGIPNLIGLPSSEQFSLAPALEYNWSQNYGLIGGVWFTFAGRNTVDFVSGVVAFNVYY